MSLPVVAIVGVPNVGKSTLFNRLVGRRQAIVTAEPGVTRDRQYGDVRTSERVFRVVDTGGMTPGTVAPFAAEIEQQVEAALAEAALVLFVVDGRRDPAALDHALAERFRRARRPVLLVANKIDTPAAESLVHELHGLGLGAPCAVSAEHGRNLSELLDQIAARLGPPPPNAEDAPRAAVAIALVGRPNVGKSSLLNRLVGAERMVVSEIPGTTRDAIDTQLEFDGRRYRIIDTAGMRRRGKLGRGAERHAVGTAERSIAGCDVAVLVLDASAGLAAQDAHIAGQVHDAGKPIVVAVNKWDLVSEREEQARVWRVKVEQDLPFLGAAPLLLISARTGQRVTVILDRVDELHAAAGTWIPTPALNDWLQSLRGATGNAPAASHGLRLYYAAQTGIRPPTVIVFCNDPRRAHFSVRRHLANSLRRRFDLGPIPLRFDLRSRRAARRA